MTHSTSPGDDRDVSDAHLDGAIRSALTDIVAAAPIDERPLRSSREPERATRIATIAACVALVVVGVGVVATRESNVPTAPAADTGPDLATPSGSDPQRVPLTTIPATPNSGADDDVRSTTPSGIEPCFQDCLPTPTSLPPTQSAGYALPLLQTAPTGFLLDRARYHPGPGGFGIARYVHPDHGTQLHVTPRNFTPSDDLLEGQETWVIDGRTVFSDAPERGCLADFCSIGFFWDDGTYVSVSWVDPDEGDLVEGSDEAGLLDLVPLLVDERDSWTALGPDGDPLDDGDVQFPVGSDAVPDAGFQGDADVVVTNRNTVGGSAGQLTSLLERLGFEMFDPRNGTRGIAAQSTIYAINPSSCIVVRLSSILDIDRVEPMPDPVPVSGALAGVPFVLVELGDDIATQMGGGLEPGPDPTDCIDR